ncbi:MAG TPA: ACR family protein, partial [Stenotrophomonas sp.]|nr:ACR family protein [Stenotrophomonas sp.]
MSLLRLLPLLLLFTLAGCASTNARHWVELDGNRYHVELA